MVKQNIFQNNAIILFYINYRMLKKLKNHDFKVLLQGGQLENMECKNKYYSYFGNQSIVHKALTYSILY